MKGFFTICLVFFSILMGVSQKTNKTEQERAVEIVINSNDLMKYDKTTINVVKGKPYEITLKNIGQLPKIAMGHNLIILNPGIDAINFGSNLITKHGATLQNEWKPVKADKMVLAQTKMLGPNEQDTIKVTFDKKGVYHYLCSFPGHFGQMRGTINVK